MNGKTIFFRFRFLCLIAVAFFIWGCSEARTRYQESKTAEQAFHNYNGIIEELSRNRGITRRNPIYASYGNGVRAAKKRNYSSAISYFEKGLTQIPKRNAESWNFLGELNLAHVYVQSDKPDEALIQLNSAIIRSKKDIFRKEATVYFSGKEKANLIFAHAYRLRAEILEKKGQYKGAVRDFQQGVVLGAKELQAEIRRLNSAEAQARRKKSEEEKKAKQEAQRKKFHAYWYQVYDKMADGWRAEKSGRLREALRLYHQAITAKDPNGNPPQPVINSHWTKTIRVGFQWYTKEKKRYVLWTYSGSAAEKAGLNPGDEFLSIAGKLTNTLDAHSILRLMSLGPGGSFRMKVAGPDGNPREVFIRPRIILRTHWVDDVVMRIARIARQLDPPPAVPEAARRHVVRAQAILKGAKTSAEFRKAAGEIIAAIRLAPWWADAHFNLAVVNENQNNPWFAMHSLRVYLAANPDAPDARAVKNKIYELEIKVDEWFFLRRLNGTWWSGFGWMTAKVNGNKIRFVYQNPSAKKRNMYGVKKGMLFVEGEIRGKELIGHEIAHFSKKTTCFPNGRREPIQGKFSENGQMLQFESENVTINIKSCKVTKIKSKSAVKMVRLPSIKMGFTFSHVSPKKIPSLPRNGLLVKKLNKNGPAMKAGMKEGDVILSYGGKPVKNTIELYAAMGESHGTIVPVGIFRDGRELELKVMVTLKR